MIKETLKSMTKNFGAIEAKTSNYEILFSEIHNFVKQYLSARNFDFAKSYLDKLRMSYYSWPSIRVYETLKADILSHAVELSLFAKSLNINKLFEVGSNLFTVNENLIFPYDIEEMYAFLDKDPKLHLPFSLAILAYANNTLQKLYQYDSSLFETKKEDLERLVEKVDNFISSTYRLL